MKVALAALACADDLAVAEQPTAAGSILVSGQVAGVAIIDGGIT